MAEVIGSLRWYLEIDGITNGIFKEVSGLDSETEVIEHRHTGPKGNIVVVKIPGALKYGNITLKRGVTDNENLWNWRKKIEDGQIESNRKNGTITCYAPDQSVVAKFSFTQAWPCKFKMDTLDAKANDIAIEEYELAVETLERTQ